MIKRTLNPEFISSVVNHPDVSPWVGGEMDVRALVRDPRNYTLVTPHGGFIFHRHEPCVYEAHTQFMPTTPPSHVLVAARAARRWMFSHTDVLEAYTKVAVNNTRATKLTEALPWVYRFTGGVWPGDPNLKLRHYIMRYEDWVLNDRGLADEGAMFHEQLTAAGVHVEHPEDAVHNSYVGATIQSIFHGQALKGVSLYNLWAKSVGYATISIESQSPLIVNIQTCRLHIHDQQFEVLTCQ